MWITDQIPSPELSPSVTDTLGFKQLVQHITHTGGNTQDLARGAALPDLAVSPYTSASSDRVLLTLQVLASCTQHRYGR